MKILRITLSNIASLAGQHTVDFTQEPLRSAGLYAICGDTGSGKSSLLDAMCLALYGKTPRLKDSKTSLEKINNDEKQLDPRSLLRRGTAEGMAEVAFVGVDGKSWTARWSVRRARKSVSGKLQQVDRTLFQGHIAPAGDGTIESGGKKTEVDAAIEKKLGLTFDQFTRAVLLAQNEFAVFLQSDDKSRAEILQALTGTGRFEEISRAVFERCKAERQQIEDLKSRLSGGTVLPDADRAEKNQKLVEATTQLASLQSQHKQLEVAQDWHQQLEKHTAALAATQSELDRAKERLTDSHPRKQQLRYTEHALRHTAPLRQAVSAAEADFRSLQTDLKSATKSLEECELSARQVVGNVDTAEHSFQTCRLALEQLQPQLILVAELETSVRLQSATTDKSSHALAQAIQQHKEAAEQLGLVSDALKAVEQERKELIQQQQDLRHYKPFVAKSETWSDRIERVAKTQERSIETAGQLEISIKELNQLREQQKSADRAWQHLLSKVKLSQTELKEAEAAAQRVDRDKLSQQRDLQLQRQEIWSGLTTFLNTVQECEQELGDCTAKQSECASEIQRQTSQLRELAEAKIPSATLTVENREASLRVVQAAISDEAIRLRLQLDENQPCSVCGSLQHPYSAQPPSADQTAVKALRQLLVEAQTALKELTQKKSTVEAERRANETRQREFQALQEKLTREKSALSFAHADHKEVVALQGKPIDQQRLEADIQLTKIREVLQNLRQQEKQVAEAELTAANARTTLQQIQNQERTAKERLSQIQNEIGTAETENKHLLQRDNELKTELANQLLQLEELFAAIPDSLAQFESNTFAFRDHFRAATERAGDVETRLTKIDLSVKQATDQLNTLRPVVESALQQKMGLQAEFDGAKQQLADLRKRQHDLFHGRNAEAVKAELEKELKTADQRLLAARKKQTETESLFAAAKRQFEETTKRTRAAEQKVGAAKEVMTKWRSEFNTTNNIQLSDDDLGQMLSRSDDWLKSENEALEQLAAAVQTRTGQTETLQTQLKELRDHRPSEATLLEVTEQLASVSQQIKDIQQQKEDVQKDLNIDNAQRDKNRTLQSQLTKKEEVATPWMRLNEVIGSSDGSSFRNIAQRHTLDILLRFANYQLRLLSGRYRLERIPNSLNLMVVDQEMADERRSIHSLSGGESFLVSLALALGLASLTSNRLKIESLFIDEGFGSLDPNTLDLAMNALMQLESQGRKVGIISHVTTMTDAIPVQIKVAKGSSGASTIQMPVNSNVKRRRSPSRPAPTIQQSLFPEQ